MINTKYYILKEASGTKETGSAFPQSQTTTMACRISVRKISQGILPKSEMDFNCFILEKRAKVSDAVSSTTLGGKGLIVSSRLKHLLTSFNLPPHAFYPARLCRGKFEEPPFDECFDDYFVLVTEAIGMEYIDFSQMVFIHKIDEENQEVISITNEDEFLSTYARFPVGSFDNQGRSIYLTPEFNRNLDIFRIERFHVHLIISERLKKTLEQEKITGIKFVDASHIHFSS